MSQAIMCLGLSKLGNPSLTRVRHRSSISVSISVRNRNDHTSIKAMHQKKSVGTRCNASRVWVLDIGLGAYVAILVLTYVVSAVMLNPQLTKNCQTGNEIPFYSLSKKEQIHNEIHLLNVRIRKVS